MVIIAGYVLVDEGQRDAYVEAHRDLVERARAFEGWIDLAITADPVDQRRVDNLEVWASADVLDAWRGGESTADRHQTRRHAGAALQRRRRWPVVLARAVARGHGPTISDSLTENVRFGREAALSEWLGGP
jgi:quinol monooxygenase YgiN